MKPLSYFDLVEAFSQTGCAVCNLLQRDSRRYLDAMLYERVNDPSTHQGFRGRRGLCNEHSWQLTRLHGYSLGIAILYRASVDEILNTIEQAPSTTAPAGLARLFGNSADSGAVSLADHLQPQKSCLACQALAESEKGYIWTLDKYITDERMTAAYRASSGLCLPHFRQALQQASDAAQANLLISIQRAIWSNLKAELEEFIAKNDYRRSGEKMGAEGDSWLRAIESLAGKEGVFGNDPR